MSPNAESKEIENIPGLEKVDPVKVEKYEKLTNPLKLNDETMLKIRKIFEDEMDLGLQVNPKGCLQMANTYIPQLPDGSEEGEYLALDLGGTNFRVLLLKLEHGKMADPIVKHFHVREDIRLGKGEAMFDFLASCIHQFLESNNMLSRKLPLGFTFSFPMYQKSLSCAHLVSWTKSFNCEGVVDQDVVKMLNDAIHRRGDLQVEVAAILNDTTGTLINGAYLDGTCSIGLILGTGSNACYLEKVERVKNWEGEKPSDIKEVIIDIEDGAFGDNGVIDFIKTEYDREVDNKSLLVNSFTFEKYFAGQYIGDIVRVILVKLAQEGIIFGGKLSTKLLTHQCFNASLLSSVEQDSIQMTTTNCRKICQDLDLEYDDEDIAILKHICYIVSDRAAKLVSITLASLLDRMDKPGLVTIAIDGSLYKHHPRLDALLKKYIAKFAPNRQFCLMLAEDGSGKGAGLTAAIAQRLRKSN
ncbi:hexokinase-1 [Folsomia candida]|uniref:Phosphotransferase n=1 Tax=Folsomia candida TaxID=158441 RepID=A0A226D844_FOLCA|nr:hexokinase-1 [Folsomia candida]OXA41712.1 Hexokinase-1 [Folsomia candida]